MVGDVFVCDPQFHALRGLLGSVSVGRACYQRFVTGRTVKDRDKQPSAFFHYRESILVRLRWILGRARLKTHALHDGAAERVGRSAG